MAQPDRATIDVMNKVMDQLFGKRKSTPQYAKGSLNEIPDTRKPNYKNDLMMLAEAGISKDQLLRLMNFAQVDPASQRMILAKHKVKVDQQPIIRNQKEVTAIRDAFLKQHTKDALNTTSPQVNKYSEQAVKASGYFSRYKQVASSPAKLKTILNVPNVTNLPTFTKTFDTFGSQVGVIGSGAAHTIKMIKDLEAYGKKMAEYRAKIQNSRDRGGQSWASGSMLNQMGTRSSSPYTQPISSPTQLRDTPLNTSMQQQAASVIKDIQRRQALSGFTPPTSNYMSEVAKLTNKRQPKVQQSSIMPNLNFMGSRGSSPAQSSTWLQRNKSRLLDVAMLGGGLGGLGLIGNMIGSIPMPFSGGGSPINVSNHLTGDADISKLISDNFPDPLKGFIPSDMKLNVGTSQASLDNSNFDPSKSMVSIGLGKSKQGHSLNNVALHESIHGLVGDSILSKIGDPTEFLDKLGKHNLTNRAFNETTSTTHLPMDKANTSVLNEHVASFFAGWKPKKGNSNKPWYEELLKSENSSNLTKKAFDKNRKVFAKYLGVPLATGGGVPKFATGDSPWYSLASSANAREKYARNIMGSGIENLGVFNSKIPGGLFNTGTIDKVAYTKEQEAMGDAVSIHNHPSGGTFSPSDIAGSIMFDAERASVISKHGGISTLNRPDSGWRTNSYQSMVHLQGKLSKARDDVMKGGINRGTYQDMVKSYNGVLKAGKFGSDLISTSHIDEAGATFAKGGSIYGSADISMLSGLLAPKQQDHVNSTLDIASGIFGKLGKTKLNQHVLDQSLQLHDIAKDVNEDKHGSFGSRFIKQTGILNDSPFKDLISFLVDKHQGVNMPKISGFGKQDQKQLKGLIPLMRISDTLSRGSFDSLPIAFGKSGKMKLTTDDIGLSSKKMKRLMTSINAYNRNSAGYAKGGNASLGNPIRVSDGELAISRGMTQAIGLDVLRKLNMGDMSAIASRGFSTGGMFEYNGPGTGTSDSILEDADRGVKGPSPDDVGFIIKRSSSDKIKSLLGGSLPKSGGVGRYANGGQLPGYALGQQVQDSFAQMSGQPKLGKKTMHPTIAEIIGSDVVNPAMSTDKIFDAIFSDPRFISQVSHLTSGKKYEKDGKTYTPSFQKGFDSYQDVVKNALSPMLPASVSDGQKTAADIAAAEAKHTSALDKNSKLLDQQSEAIKKSIGAYHGRMSWMGDPNKQGDPHATNVMGMIEARQANQNYLPGRTLNSPDLHGMVTSMGILEKLGSKASGFFDNVKKEIFTPTENRVFAKSRVSMPVGTTGYATEQERAHFESNRTEFDAAPARIEKALITAFGHIVGPEQIKSGIHINQNIQTDSSTGHDIGTMEVEASALEKVLTRHKVESAQFTQVVRTAVQPSTRAVTGLLGAQVPDPNVPGGAYQPQLIDKAKESTVEYNKEVGRTAHNNTLLYKTGDALRGISWRFASLGMSAMGVYFSIQGLLMTFQQGLASITGPLGDVDNMMKSIGMSTAFGAGIYNASTAMKDMGVTTNDMVKGWKNLTNLQGTIQTFFASIGAKVFGNKGFTDELLRGISKAFKVLGSDESINTFKALIKSVVDALPGIIPALQSITGLMKVLADNKWLIEWGAKLMMISLILQPIASGLAAIVTVGGGIATISNFLFAMGGGAAFAATGIEGLGAAMALTFGYVALGIIAWEGLARAINAVAGTKIPTPSSMASDFVGGILTPKQGFASGGTVRSEGYDMVPGSPDDTIVSVKVGETVRTPAQERDLQKKLRGNKLQGFANGLMPSAMVNTPNVTSPANQTYQFNASKDLANINNLNTGKTASVLGDVQNGDALNVIVKNMPVNWGAGGSGDISSMLPSDIGYPYHLNPNMAFKPGNFNPTVPNPTSFSPDEITNPTDTTTTPTGTTFNPTPTTTTTTTSTTTSPNPSPSPTITADSIASYISQVLSAALDSFSETMQNSLGKVTDGLMNSFDGIYTALGNAKDAIGNIVVAISSLDVGNVSQSVKSAGSGVINATSSFLNGSGATNGLSIAPNALPKGSGIGYDNIFYSHAGYNELGTTGNYLSQRTLRSGYMDRYNKGRYQLPSMPLPKSSSPTIAGGRTPGAGNIIGTPGPHATDFWSWKQLTGVPDWQDMVESLRALTTGDPIKVAKSVGSVIASNAIVGGVGKGLQYGSLAFNSGFGSKVIGKGGASLLGRVGAHAGSLFTGANVLAGDPAIMAAGHVTESGQAFDEYMKGRSTQDLMTGNFNNATGMLTGGFSTAGLGKGLSTIGGAFGMSDESMQKKMQGYQDVFNIPTQLAGGPLAIPGLLGKTFGTAIKSTTGAGDLDTQATELISSIPILGGFINGINSAAKEAGTQDVGSIAGSGISLLGIGAGAAETGKNAVGMVSQNPYSLLYGGLQAGLGGAIPIPGASLAMSMLSDVAMPKTAAWASQQGYGVQDAGEAVGWRSTAASSLTMGDTGDATKSPLTDLITSINNLISSQSQQAQTPPQPITVNATIQVNGDELATKGYVNATINTEVPTIISQNKSRIVGH